MQRRVCCIVWLTMLSLSQICFAPEHNGTSDLSLDQKSLFGQVSPTVYSYFDTLDPETHIMMRLTGKGIVTGRKQVTKIVDGQPINTWQIYILTVKHIFTPESLASGKAKVTYAILKDDVFTESFEIPARIVKVSDKQYDLVLLVVETQDGALFPDIVPIVLDQELPNTPVYIWGPPKDKVRGIENGRCKKELPRKCDFILFSNEKSPGVSFSTSLVTTCITTKGGSGNGFLISMEDKKFASLGILVGIHIATGNTFGLTGQDIQNFAWEEHVEYAFTFIRLSDAVAVISKSHNKTAP
jgi:hypothetical protein